MLEKQGVPSSDDEKLSSEQTMVMSAPFREPKPPGCDYTQTREGRKP